MRNYEEYSSLNPGPFDADEAIAIIKKRVDEARKGGWDKIYITTDETLISIMGVKPPDPEAVAAAKEKRRKQFERLKKEFEGEERERMTKLIDKMTLK